MNKNNRNNEQIYGRNDMIMLDQNNKIYGSLGLADRYVMKTEEGTRLMLSNPKLGSFDDVLTELNIYGWSKQETTTGAQLWDEDNAMNGYILADGTVQNANKINNEVIGDYRKVSGNNITLSYSVTVPETITSQSLWFAIGCYDSEKNFLTRKVFQRDSATGLQKGNTTIELVENMEYIRISWRKYADGVLMASEGTEALPYEPYTGGQPSPSPDYPQEIKSVVNPIVKVTNEDGLKVQSVTLNNITLNAIPVKSGGNVTINGQQYIADYVDIEKGKLYRKVMRLNLKDVDATNIAHGFHSNGNGYLSFSIKNVSKEHQPISNRYRGSEWTQTSGYMYIPNSNTIVFVDDRFTDKQTAIKLVQDTYVIYALSSPTEEDLSLEQIKSIKSLSTYYPVTIVENNYNTWMKATYKSTESV